MSDARPVVIHFNEKENSGIGTAGLIFSCLGWLTCGILSPIGALLSMLGLLCRGSKSHAIAGLLVGFPGVIFLVFIGAGLVAGFLGIAGVTTAAVAEASRQVELRQNMPVIPQPKAPVEAENVPIEPLPSNLEIAPEVTATDLPTSNLLSEPKELELLADSAERVVAPVFREWTSAERKFKTEAKLVEVTGENIVLEKKNGTRITLPAIKLSAADQEFAKSFNAESAKPLGDLLELAGEAQDGSIAIRCYSLTRADSKEAIIARAKELVATMHPGKEVAYIFSVKKGVDAFVAARSTNAQFSPRLEKWMRDYHFATISYMNDGNQGSRWELIQTNKVADRKFNNKMESIPLSEAK